ncbi:MAG: lysophospholipid acyltransferase family protein [Candidatus Omnitrophota bacterium]|jgi:KDO2-lipid IV(A) lauroyltransferase
MIYYLIYKIGVFVAIHLPRRWAYRVAIFVSDLHYLFAYKDRANVAANLKAIFPEKKYSEIKKIRLAMARNFAKYLTDFFRFSLLNNENIKRLAAVEGLHYFDEALAKGNGVIALTAHIGNWELAGVTVTLLGYPVWAVALPHRHKSVDNFFNQQRERNGMGVIPLGRAAYHCLKLLRENKIIALAGDRVFNTTGIRVDFFGLPTYLPQGPAAFSLKTGAPIIPGFMIRNPDDTFKLIFEKPIEFQPCGDKAKDKIELTSKCRSKIEDYIRRYPEQWFMFRKFWIEK